MKQSNQIAVVARYTFMDAVRKKAFWVTNIIVVALIIGLALFTPMIGEDESDMYISGDAAAEIEIGGGYSSEIYLIDESGGLLGDAKNYLEEYGMFEVTVYDATQLEICKQLLEENGGAAVVRISGDDGLPLVEIITQDDAWIDTFQIEEAFNALNRTLQMKARGLTDQEANDILSSALTFSYEIIGEAESGSNMLIGSVLMILMFFAIYYYGYAVAISVATEKSTRVMETLIVSAKPSHILLGKCIAMGTLGIVQMTGLIAIGGIALSFFAPESTFEILAIEPIPITKILLILLYFALGYALFVLINSVCGATVSKTEDLNSAMMPATMLTLASFYGGYFANLMPAAVGVGTGANITTYIPFTAPFSVPFLLLTSDVPSSTIAVSLVLLAATTVLIAFISTRIYSASVLHYGARLKLSAVIRMLRDKNI
ncbi:MAG: ABC transporter permease [Oscillospiraceae bacterium]|jgi:ABC-2 type transport system permease protein|nr:ABC transporter permease [Oscillospiraceae bacterium]